MAAACQTSFLAAFSNTDTSETQDRRLERLTGRLVRAHSLEDLQSCLPTLAAELSADHVHVLAGPPQAAHQTLISDLHADAEQLAEMLADGHRAMLTLPIGHTGRLNAYRREDRPWTRFHIGRARILAHQLEPVLARNLERRRELAAATASSTRLPTA